MAPPKIDDYSSSLYQPYDILASSPNHAPVVEQARTSNVGSPPPAMSSASQSNGSFSDVSKNLLLKQQTIKHLVHASICMVDLKIGATCSSCRNCYAMRTLYNHVSKCSNKHCLVPRCGNYRSAFRHLQRCRNGDCLICQPVQLCTRKLMVAPPPKLSLGTR